MSTVEVVTLWVCDECGYYRIEKSTGVHSAMNLDDPRGAYLSHALSPVRFHRVPVYREDDLHDRECSR